MKAMLARFVIATAVAVLVAGGLGAAPKSAGAQAVSQADAAIVDVCRFLPFWANPSVAGASSTVFAVRVTNIGPTASDGPVVAGTSQLTNLRGGKRDLVPVTPGPLQPGQTARFKFKDNRLFPGVEFTVIAAFDGRANPSDGWDNNQLTFADPWAVPAC